MKKIVSLVLVLALVLSFGMVLTSCGGSGNGAPSNGAPANGGEAPSVSDNNAGGADNSQSGPAVKIGVLVADATSGEALGFRAYYEEYLEKNYNVDFIYSDELNDAAAEIAAIDTMVANNCKAIISFASADRTAQIDKCESEEVYYAVATGTLTDEQYEQYKDYQYYVGAIGPDVMVEYQAGYDMAKHYLDQGMTKFGIFGGAVPYRTEMHVFRVAGMIQAMIDAGGPNANYCGASDLSSIVGIIMGSGTIETGPIGTNEIVSYNGGYDFDDAWFAANAAAITAPGVEAFLTVGSGVSIFGASKPENVKLATVDSFVAECEEAMKAGTLDYLAGKFSSINGPIFIATLRAVQGDKLTTAEGGALAINQGYWVATSAAEYDAMKNGDSVSNPAYTKDVLDQYINADIDTFTTFVGQCSFEEIAALKK